MTGIAVTVRVTDRGGAWTEAHCDAWIGTGDKRMTDEVLVACSNAPNRSKDLAELVLTGTGDSAKLQAACDLARSTTAGGEQRGGVRISGGTVFWDAPVHPDTGVHLAGRGRLTECRAVGLGSSPMLSLASVNSHLVEVSDLWLNGNSAAGGTGNLIDFDMSGSSNTGGYPGVNSDADHHLHDLLITNAKNAATRTGIRLWSAATANNRGNTIRDVQIRDMGGMGIDLSTASDSFVSQCHVGGCGGTGVRLAGGNSKIQNVKTFYCGSDDGATGYGFECTSSALTATGLESQDNAAGYYLGCADSTLTGILADTSGRAGVIVAVGGLTLTGLKIRHRTGGRYPTGTAGVVFNGTYSNSTIAGSITPANITAPLPASNAQTAANWNSIDLGYGTGRLKV